MTLRTVLLLMAALAVAGLTALFARGWINAQKAALSPEVRVETVTTEAVNVLVAKQPIVAGSFVKPDMLTWRAWPEDGVIDAYAVEGEVAVGAFEGAVARSGIAEGQPILAAQVVHPGERGFLAAVLTPGKRAVSVPVDATSGISGFVFPGDKVDLLLTVTFQVKDREGEMHRRHATRTLLRDVRILAIDQKVEQADGQISVAKTATVEVVSDQAERIALALQMGAISLSLRSLAKDAEMAVADPPGRKGYLLDTQVFGIVGGRAGGREINVLRGNQADVAAF